MGAPSKLCACAEATHIDLSWHSGDLAECCVAGEWVEAADFSQPPSAPCVGDRFVVATVDIGACPCGHLWLFLGFERWPTDLWCANRFRKIVPQADTAEAADADFLSTLKPARVLEPASGDA